MEPSAIFTADYPKSHGVSVEAELSEPPQQQKRLHSVFYTLPKDWEHQRIENEQQYEEFWRSTTTGIKWIDFCGTGDDALRRLFI